MAANETKELFGSEEFKVLEEAHRKIHDHRNKVLVSKRGNRWLNTKAGRVIEIPRPLLLASNKSWKKSYIGVGRRIVGTMITNDNGKIEFIELRS